ncbi:MAG TPA: hypothetical protein VNV66_20145 [Pilimelia sp.]|nr:hypothetical protein [Pilimelia sp.]
MAAAAPRPRRARLLAVVGAVTALTLVAVGGAYAAALWTRSRGVQPEAAVPASVAAFARVDLAPAYGQRVELDRLLRRFTSEDRPVEQVAAQARDRLVTGAAPGLTAADVTPWFGNRVGVGVWTHAERPVLLVALASDDDTKAAAALTQARQRAGGDRLGFAFHEGYAVLAKAETGAAAAAAAAVAATRTGNLAGSTPFAAARATLPADPTLLAWADLDRLAASAGRATRTAPRERRDRGRPDGPGLDIVNGAWPLVPGLLGRPDALDGLTGRLILGARPVGGGVELRARGIGLPARGGGRAARPALDAMPGNSLVAGALGGGGHLAALVGGLAGPFLGLAVLTPGAGGPLPGPAGTPRRGDLPYLRPEDLPTPHPGQVRSPSPGVLVPADPSELEEIFGPDALRSLPPGVELRTGRVTRYTMSPQEAQEYFRTEARQARAQAEAALRRQLAESRRATERLLAALSGLRSADFAVTALGDGLPGLRVELRAADVPAAEELAAALGPTAGGDRIFGLGPAGQAPPSRVTRHGDRVEVTTVRYAPAGRLADSARYRAAMAGAPDGAHSAVFVDLERVLAQPGAPAEDRRALGPIRALGLTAAADGGDTVLLLRVLID